MVLYAIGLLGAWGLVFADAPRVLAAGVLCAFGTLNDIRVGRRRERRARGEGPSSPSHADQRAAA
jgi:hypothetical protein